MRHSRAHLRDVTPWPFRSIRAQVRVVLRGMVHQVTAAATAEEEAVAADGAETEAEAHGMGEDATGRGAGFGRGRLMKTPRKKGKGKGKGKGKRQKAQELQAQQQQRQRRRQRREGEGEEGQYALAVPTAEERNAFETGMCCMCYYEADGLMYPALVLSLPQRGLPIGGGVGDVDEEEESEEDERSGSLARVKFLGYGNEGEVEVSWLVPMPANYAEHYQIDQLIEAAHVKSTAYDHACEEGEEEEEEEVAEECAVAVSNFFFDRAGFLQRRHETVELLSQLTGGVAAPTEDGQRKLDDSPNPFAGELPDRYWVQRYRYFSRWDSGCVLDAQGFYSVTPEAIAQHIAHRAACTLAIDAFCGAGGNAIQLALTCHHVVAIDLDATRLNMARQNARVYGVEDYIDFVHGNALDLLPQLASKADVVLLSPPWGGVDYAQSPRYDLHQSISIGHGPAGDLEPRLNGVELFRFVNDLCAPDAAIVYLLPKTLPTAVIQECFAGIVAKDTDKDKDEDAAPLEVEEQYLMGKLKMKVLFSGPVLPNDTGDDDDDDDESCAW